MAAIPTLNTDDDINTAILDGTRFRIGAEITSLEVATDIIACQDYVEEALRNNTSITSLKINHFWNTDPGQIVPLLASLKHSKIWQELTVVSDKDDMYVALGTLLKENTLLKSLSISGLGYMKPEEFYSGLARNSSLLRLELTRFELENYSIGGNRASITAINENFRKIIAALRLNPNIKQFAIQSGSGACFSISPDKSLSDAQAARLCITIERKAPAKEFLLSNSPDWEAMAKFLKETCPARIVEGQIYPQDCNLSNKTFADQLAVHSISQLLNETKEETNALMSSLTEKMTKSETLSAKLIEVRRQLLALETELEQVNEEIKSESNSLTAKNSALDNLLANLTRFQAALSSNEPALKRWQKKLQTDLSTWSIEDVSLLLAEVGLKNYASAFATNNIDGSALACLDTNDLMTLHLSFKDTKKLQMYVHLVQTQHDIYTIPPGVLQWNNDTVCTWLEDNKFGHLVDVFKKNQITGVELAFLEKADLTNHLKIATLGDVVKLQKESSKLRDSLRNEQILELKDNNNDQLARQLDEMKRFNEELKMTLKERETKIPEAFICPITQDMMQEPVVASDGHTYERTAIELWLKNNNTSPMTGLQLSNKQLTPSHTLKSMIREFVDANKKK